MKKIFLLVLLALTVSVNAMANNSVSPKNDSEESLHKYIYRGYVVNNSNKQPLPNSYVELVGERNSAVTDELGSFEIHFNDSGKYVLEVSSMGFKTQFVQFNTEELTDKPVQILMELSVMEMDEVVVTSNRTAIKKRESPVVVSTIPSTLFESLSAVDLTQGLNYTSGLRVETTCQNCGFPQLKINGLEGTYTQMLIDSRPVMGALSGVYGLEQIPLNMIDRVEIIKGGGSTLYGSSAIAGVVNLITKEPSDNFASASANYSTLGNGSDDYSINANGGIVSKDEKHGLTLFGSHRKRTPYDRNGDGYSEIGKLNSTNFGLKGYSKTSLLSKLSYEYHIINEFRRGGNDFELPAFQSDITEQTDYTINALNLNFDQFISNYNNKLSVYTSLQHTYRDSYYGSDEDTDAYGTTKEFISLSGVQMSHNIKKFIFAPANLIYGSEFRFNNLSDKMPGYNRDLEQVVRQWSGFVQNQWNVGKFNILGGVRLESHNLVKNIVAAPRANVLYKTTDKLSFRVSYANGFKAPEAFDEDLHVSLVGGEPVIIQLDDNLKPERSNSYSGSVDWFVGEKDFRANFILDGFYTDLKDVFVLLPTTSDNGANTYIKSNGGGAYVGGLNLDATLFYKDFIQLKMGYTFQKSKYKEDYYWSEDESVAPVKDRLRSPEHYGYFSFLINPTKALSINLNATYTGSMLVPHMAGYIEHDVLEKTPSFFDMGIKLAYDFALSGNTVLQVNGGVKNIFDSFQDDFDLGMDRDSKYVYGPTLPRSFFVGVKLAF